MYMCSCLKFLPFYFQIWQSVLTSSCKVWLFHDVVTSRWPTRYLVGLIAYIFVSVPPSPVFRSLPAIQDCMRAWELMSCAKRHEYSFFGCDSIQFDDVMTTARQIEHYVICCVERELTLHIFMSQHRDWSKKPRGSDVHVCGHSLQKKTLRLN